MVKRNVQTERGNAVYWISKPDVPADGIRGRTLRFLIRTRQRVSSKLWRNIVLRARL